MKLEDFGGRPDRVGKITVNNVWTTKICISWETPESNNSEIVEYTINCTEININTMEYNFKWMYRSDTNSVTIEDLEPSTWYEIDVRAQNSFGICPVKSKFFWFKTTESNKGDLYSWGNNTSFELGVNYDDVNSAKLYDRDNHIHYLNIRNNKKHDCSQRTD